MRNLLWASLATFIVCATPVWAMLVAKPAAVGEIAFVVPFPFGVPISEILSATNLTDAYPERAMIGAFVIVENAEMLSLLYENGAWFVADGTSILALC